MADHHEVLLAFCQHAGPEYGVRVAVDDYFDGLLTNGPNRRQHEFAVVLGIAGVEGDESVFGLDDAHWGEPVTAEDPHSFRRLLDRRFEPVEVADAIEEFPVRDGAIRRFRQFDRGTHVRRGSESRVPGARGGRQGGGEGNCSHNDEESGFHVCLTSNQRSSRARHMPKHLSFEALPRTYRKRPTGDACLHKAFIPPRGR